MPDRPQTPARPDSRGASRRGPRRVLVVRLSAIGDVLHAMPAVQSLKAARPDLEIDWLVEDRAAAVLDGFPAVERVHRVPRARWSRALRRVATWPRLAVEVTRFVAGLVARRFDATLDLQGNLKSGLWALASGAPARVGFPTRETREANGFFTNRHVAIPDAVRHRVERALAVASVLAGEPLRWVGTGLETNAAAAAGAAASRAWSAWSCAERVRAGIGDGAFVVLHPGTSGFGQFKRWPAERFARLADRIGERSSARVLVTGAPGEESLLADVCRRAAKPPPSLVTPSLDALGEILRRACAFVSADTGPLHLAAAVGTPVVGLYGPKDVSTYGPYGARDDGTVGPLTTLVRDDVPCRPCAVRWCPEPVCMSAIDEEDVLAALAPHLPRGRARG